MKMTFRSRFVALLLGLCAAAPALADDAAGTTVLKGKNVTEENLLDALTPTPTPLGDGVVTRSLRVRPSAGGVPSPAPAPARKPSASLLITFETNSAELTAAAKQQLDIVGAALKNDRLADYNFNVEGHADPRGNSEANMLLSKQRAESVRAYLVGTHGIVAQRLIAEGKGDQELLNRAVPAAPENRRVTIVTNVP
jgi:outer membrane protein OmpA-like peptidoglycan-associated protein